MCRTSKSFIIRIIACTAYINREPWINLLHIVIFIFRERATLVASQPWWQILNKMKTQAQMASFVVVGQNAEFFKHSITAVSWSTFGVMQISLSFHDYKLLCTIVLWRCLRAGLRSTPKYSGVPGVLRSTHGVNWEYFKVLRSYSGVPTNTPDYSRVLPSTPKYSKKMYGENINFCYVWLKSGCCCPPPACTASCESSRVTT